MLVKDTNFGDQLVLDKLFIPQISIDCVVFGFDEAALKVLLVKYKYNDKWALPGGYIKRDEDINDAAQRILQERTGAKDIFLQNFDVFGATNRTGNEIPKEVSEWHSRRFISIGYYALVNYKDVTPVIDELSIACEWIDINDLPELIMDHNPMVNSALTTLRKQLNDKPVGLNLLPEIFTMPELQKLYEVILNKELNRGNFYRKIMKYNILDKLDGTRKGGAHKSPNLYKFNMERYTEALKDGFKEVW